MRSRWSEDQGSASLVTRFKELKLRPGGGVAAELLTVDDDALLQNRQTVPASIDSMGARKPK